MATEYWGIRNRLTGRLQLCRNGQSLLMRHFEHAEARCESLNKAAGINVYAVVQVTRPREAK